MSTRRTNRRTGKPPVSLRNLFLIAFLVAAGGALAAGTNVGWAVGWAVFCMFAYLGSARLWHRAAIHDDDFADSFYYLGFLLTLVALIGVLVHLGNLADESLLEAVLTHFGLALVTTLIGLLGRISLTMFRGTPDSLEESAREKTEDAYDRLTKALETMAAEAEAFGNGFATRLEKALGPMEPAVQRLVSGADKAAQGIEPLQGRLGALNSALVAAEGDLGAASEAYRTRLRDGAEDVLQTLREDAATLASSVSTLAAAADDMNESTRTATGGMAASTRNYQEQLEQAAGAVEGTVTAVTRTAAMARELEEATRRSVSALGDGSDQLTTTLDRLNHASERLASALGDEEQALRARLASWQQSVDELEALQARIRSAGESSEQAAAELSSNAGNLHKKVRSFQDGLSALTNTIETEGERVRGSLGGWTRSLEALDGLHQQMLSTAHASMKSTEEVREEIAAGVAALNRVLGGTESNERARA